MTPTDVLANGQTEEQVMGALALANVIRAANAKTMRHISSLPYVKGVDALIDILESGDEQGPLGALPIIRLLKAPRGMGEGKAALLLRTAGVLTGDRKFRQLTRRQRDILVTCLREPRDLWPRSSLPRQRSRGGRAA